MRFEDTDRERSHDEYKGAMRDDLAWLGLRWDEPVISQSERLERYAQIREQLALSGRIYPCFCPQSGAESSETKGRCACFSLSQSQRREQTDAGLAHCWRLVVDSSESSRFTDSLRGEITISNDNFGDFVVFRSDGWPTYLLAVVVDDHDMEITQVIRGEEHLSNVPKQLLVYNALGWTAPEWVHIPMVLDLSRQKLSKRTGALGIGEYRKEGWAPEALTAYMGTLSWSRAPSDRIASPDELARIFNLNEVALASPVHDPARLRHFGTLALINSGAKSLRDSVSSRTAAQPCDIDLLIGEILPGCASEGEFKEAIDSLCTLPEPPLFEGGIPHWFPKAIEALRQFPAGEWDAASLKMRIKGLPKEYGVKAPHFYHPLRAALTGREEGLPIPLLCAFFGMEETINRLENSIAKWGSQNEG